MSLPEKQITNKPMKTIKMHSITLRTGRLRTVLSVALAAGLLSAAVKADVVTDWNQTTLNTLAAVGQRRTPPSGRLLAMVHSAMHDSINAIDRRFNGYAVNIQANPSASSEAAAAAAAHAVLLNQIPSQQANLDAAYAASLDQRLHVALRRRSDRALPQHLD